MIGDCELKIKTIFGIPNNCIEEATFHTKTDFIFCLQNNIGVGTYVDESIFEFMA